MKSKEFGFSLIELLAVIALLGIILLIAVPVIGNIVKDTRRKAFYKDATTVVRSSEFLYKTSILKDKQYNKIIIDFDTNENVHLLNLKSSKNPSGTVIIRNTGEIVLSLTDDEFCAITENNKVIVRDYKEGDECGERPSYPFITKWRTTEDNLTITMPFSSSYEYDITVNWGDGTIEDYKTHDVSHTYSQPGDYEIKITGVMPSFKSVSNNTMIEIIDFGEVKVREIQFGGSSQNICDSLTGSIPSPRKQSFKYVEEFNYTFSYCTNLVTEIPSDLFKSAINAVAYKYIFSSATGFSGEIPSDLFKYSPKVTTFIAAFRNANNLTGSIPEDLFKYNPDVVSFRATFYGNKGLSGEIPENLFKYNTNVTTFDSTFAYATNLSGEIPENLFKYNTNAQIFRSTFLGATGFSGEIPKNLFADNDDVTDFYQVFSNATNLTGNAPDLWNTHKNATSERAFRNLTKLSNYADIPDAWKF